MAQCATYYVHDLDCADEVVALREALEDRDGILELQFDILNARMSVNYDPDRIDPDAIADTVVRQTGMRIIPWAKRGAGESESFWSRHGRLVTTAVSGVCLLAAFGSHWFLRGDVLHAPGPDPQAGPHRLPLPALILYACAVVAGGWYVAPRALSAARRFRPDMNLLMTIAVAGALLIGEWFEAGMVAFLFSLSLLLEHWSVDRARNAVAALLELSPPVARCIDPESGQEQERPVESVTPGTTILVRPGEKVPLDGVVEQGESAVDQSPITGESMPVGKASGDPVYAATINTTGALQVRTTKTASDTTLAHIIHQVQEAQSRRAGSEQWIETFARYYTPVMLLLAALVAVVPPLVLTPSAWSEWLYRALVILVIACPCALVISTPVSIVSGLTAAARNGVLVKGGMYLEAVGRMQALAADKTGTLTYGKPEVQEVVPLNDHTADDVLRLAATLESHSEHPIGRAIRERADAVGLQRGKATGFRVVKGKGAEAEIDGVSYWIGSHRLMREKSEASNKVLTAAKKLEDAGHTVVLLGDATHVCGLISVADGVRPTAAAALQSLKAQGIEEILLLTGDNRLTAAAAAAAVGADRYEAEMLPEDKSSVMADLASRYRVVSMIGDGVNDAPAMAQATFGIAMGCAGTDVAIETADVALMSDDLAKVPWLVDHSRRTLRIIRQNVFFALGLKVLFLGLAISGFATLWMAIIADTGASLLVIGNGLRLLANDEGFPDGER